ncbi:MAG: hypothetical protein ACREUG_05570 [Steroidobacteraceae bacterium]
MRLRFYTPGQDTGESIEPGPFFRLIGGMLCRGAGNEPVATWLKRWRLPDAEFARAEALDAVVIYFENNAGLASSAFGPFESFSIANASAAAEGLPAAANGLTVCAGPRLLARLDERSLLWYPPKAHDGWASLLIAPPGKSRFDLIREQAPAPTSSDAQGARDA